jgi:hypothetical protein
LGLVWTRGNPFESFSNTYSIVTLSDKIFAVPAFLSNEIAGFIATPLPIPGCPTRTVNRLGKSFHSSTILGMSPIQTLRLRVAAIQVAPVQKWYLEGLSVVEVKRRMYSSSQGCWSFLAVNSS